MRKIVLKVIKQVLSCEGVEASYVRSVILPEYFRCFWIRRMAIEKRNYKQLIETTLELAIKVGGAEVIENIVGTLKDDNESYRKMGMEAIEKIIQACGTHDVNYAL
jgi:splicing factor 3B subunit 1